MECELVDNVCVNCGGKGGKPGPCAGSGAHSEGYRAKSIEIQSALKRTSHSEATAASDKAIIASFSAKTKAEHASAADYHVSAGTKHLDASSFHSFDPKGKGEAEATKHWEISKLHRDAAEGHKRTSQAVHNEEQMELVTANISGRTRRELLHGREYLVAPMSLIVPGVLNGSKGALYYPQDEVEREPFVWNGMPLVVNHPVVDGRNVTARDPDVLREHGIGYAYRSTAQGALNSEGWFDVELTQNYDKKLPAEQRIFPRLLQGKPIELSTGLFTTNTPETGTFNGKAYTHVARNYRPDHVAILPASKGACSNEDKCGVLVNEETAPPNTTQRVTNVNRDKMLEQLVANCGAKAEDLQGLSDETLNKLLNVKPKVQTFEQMLAEDPQRQAVWNNAVAVEQRERGRLVERLVENMEGDAKAKSQTIYAKMDIPTLQTLVAGLPEKVAAPSTPNFFGLGPTSNGSPPVENKEAVLASPTYNYAEDSPLFKRKSA